MFVLIMSLMLQAQAQEAQKKTVLCFDGKEKLIEMEVKSVKFMSPTETKIVSVEGEEFTILNLGCRLKK